MKLLDLSTLLPPVPWEWPGQCRAFHLVFHFICRMTWRQCVPWLIVAHDLLEYMYMQIHGWHHGKTVFLFCSTWHTDLNMCVWLFWIWKVKARKKNYQELETKRVLDHVENVYKLQEIFTTVKLSSLCHCCERLAVLKSVFAHYSALNNKRLQKLFEVTVHR